jgi:hypothetical protein
MDWTGRLPALVHVSRLRAAPLGGPLSEVVDLTDAEHATHWPGVMVMDGAARLAEAVLRIAGPWAFAVQAVACGVVLWAPDDTARRYGFDLFRFDYGVWFFLGFWVGLFLWLLAVFLWTLAIFQSVVPRAWIGVLDAIHEVRSRRKIWKKLADLTRDEQAVMYVLHMDQLATFKAGNASFVARKLQLAELVEYGDASGVRWMLFRVPTRVREISLEFVDAWAQALASRGFATQPALRALVGRVLDHNPL